MSDPTVKVMTSPAMAQPVKRSATRTVTTWVVSRTSGLPFGPGAGQPEPVGVADLMSTALEVVVVVGTLLLLRGLELRRSWEMRFVRPLLAVSVLAITTLALAGAAGL